MAVHTESSLLSEAFQAWGIQLHKSGREYHGPCPFCRTGTDRLVVWLEGNYWCRVCGEKGILRAGGDGKPVTAADIADAVQAQREARHERLIGWQEGHRVGYAEGWHAAMAQQHREYWRGQGISEQNIDRYLLGYCPKRQFEGRDHAMFTSDAYTIPHYDPATWTLTNMQYRINKLPEHAGGKYRQEAGIPPASFFTLPKVLTGSLILVEGGKKALVISQLIDRKVQVAGWPGATPAEDLYDQLAGFDTIWLALDPGKEQSKAVDRCISLLGSRIWVVELPEKPDDLVVQYGMRMPAFRTYLEQARPA